jgi:hypothetical protein
MLIKGIKKLMKNCNCTVPQIVQSAALYKTDKLHFNEIHLLQLLDWVDVPGSDVYIDLANEYSLTLC